MSKCPLCLQLKIPLKLNIYTLPKNYAVQSMQESERKRSLCPSCSDPVLPHRLLRCRQDASIVCGACLVVQNMARDRQMRLQEQHSGHEHDNLEAWRKAAWQRKCAELRSELANVENLAKEAASVAFVASQIKRAARLMPQQVEASFTKQYNALGTGRANTEALDEDMDSVIEDLRRLSCSMAKFIDYSGDFLHRAGKHIQDILGRVSGAQRWSRAHRVQPDFGCDLERLEYSVVLPDPQLPEHELEGFIANWKWANLRRAGVIGDRMSGSLLVLLGERGRRATASEAHCAVCGEHAEHADDPPVLPSIFPVTAPGT